MTTINLYIAENKVLPNVNPRYYVCHERPYRYDDAHLDAGYMYSSESLERAQTYAACLEAQYRRHRLIHYNLVPGVFSGRWCH